MPDAILSSSKYYPNKMGRYFLAAVRETLDQERYDDLLDSAGLSQYADSLPADNWTRAFDFISIAKLNQGLFEFFGPRGGRRLALQIGGNFFQHGLPEIGGLAGVTDLAQRSLPLQIKLRDGLMSIARMFSQTSDQNTWLVEQQPQFLYYVDPCPICWEQISPSPLCFITTGFLQEALLWLSGGQTFRVQQTACRGMGDAECIFRIDRDPVR